MRKLFSKAAMAVALAMTMLAAPMVAMAAGSASASVSAPATAKTGDTVNFTVSFSADQAILGVQGNVATSEGLEFQSVSCDLANAMNNSGAGQFLYAASASEQTSVNVTYTYTVTGEAGATLTFDASNLVVSDDNAEHMTVNGAASATVTVEAAQEPTPDDPTPDDPTPADPTPSDPTPSDPTPSNPQPSNPSTPGNQSSDKGLDDVPQTGDASSNMMVYAVVAIAAAGAIAVVSAKKFAR